MGPGGERDMFLQTEGGKGHVSQGAMGSGDSNFMVIRTV